MDAQAAASGDAPAAARPRCLLCTSLVASSVAGMLGEAQEAVQNGADVVELRLDYLEGFDAERDVPLLLAGCPLPAIVTYRPVWEGCVCARVCIVLGVCVDAWTGAVGAACSLQGAGGGCGQVK